MASASCEAMPPREASIANGNRVYRSQNTAAAINDTDEDILYNVEAIMSDSLGHSRTTSELNVVAPAGNSSASGR